MTDRHTDKTTHKRLAEAFPRLWKGLRNLFMRRSTGEESGLSCRDLPLPETANAYSSADSSQPETAESIKADREEGKFIFVSIEPGVAGKGWIERWVSQKEQVRAVYLTYGMSSGMIRYADIVYVGVGDSGRRDGDRIEREAAQTVLAAAAHGVAVLFSERLLRYPEIVDLKTLGGGIAVTGEGSFVRNADRLLFDVRERKKIGRWGKEYIAEIRAKKIDCRPDNQSSVNLKI